MPTTKVYNNPTVIKVIFQIQFPNLFYLESKIPALQLDILKEFPESELLISQPFAIINNTNNKNINELLTQKIWTFKNKKGYTLSISSSSLSIDSDVHKTYKNESCDNRFRDAIEFCLSAFQNHISLPFVNRIGLRYINKCPLSNKTTKDYEASFNSALSINKFSIEDLNQFEIKVKRNIDTYTVIYKESFNEKTPNIVMLDFDAFAQDIEYNKCLETTDKLHDIIVEEYTNTIKQPIFDYMEGDKHD